jgi:hypothetical protein
MSFAFHLTCEPKGDPAMKHICLVKYALMASIGLAPFFWSCSTPPQTKEESQAEQQKVSTVQQPSADKKVKVSVSLSYDYSGSTAKAGLALTDTQAFKMSLEGCATGWTHDNITKTTPTLDLYLYDRGCVVKLLNFQYRDITYIPETDFTTWQIDDAAVFKDPDSSHRLRVVVIDQVDNPITGTHNVDYAFTELYMGSDLGTIVDSNNIVGDAHNLTVRGVLAPEFACNKLEFKAITVDGAGQFIFYCNCDLPTTGTGATQKCGDTLLDDIKYSLVKDTFAGVLTVDNAATIAGLGMTSILATEKLAIGDPNASNGGFKTTAVLPYLTGPNQMHLNPNMILLLQAEGVSYTYFNVDVTTLSYPTP